MTRSGRRRAGPTPGSGSVWSEPGGCGSRTGSTGRRRRPKRGIDGPGTVCDGNFQRDEAGISRHLRMDGHRGRQETVRQLVRVGASEVEANRGVARADGSSAPDNRSEFGWNPGPLESRADDGLHGGAQQVVFGRKAKDPRVPDHGIQDPEALFFRWETHPTVPLTHWNQRGARLLSPISNADDI